MSVDGYRVHNDLICIAVFIVCRKVNHIVVDLAGTNFARITSIDAFAISLYY